MPLTPSQISALITIERTTASISICGTALQLGTYIFLKPFRTLSNTLIFFASFANLFANVAALIGGSALSNTNSALCQFQAFLLEMFMQSDPFWGLAMACNVYLVFFRRFDASRLKKLYPLYILLCYGIPFIPAMICLFIQYNGKGHIYGNATLWCWIDNDYAPMRIYTYYAPIWVSILLTFIIYIRVGLDIFKKRGELRDIGFSEGSYTGTGTGTASATRTGTNAGPPTKIDRNSMATNAIVGLRTTEVEVTNDTWTKDTVTEAHSDGVFAGPDNKAAGPTPDQYTITITAPSRQEGGVRRRRRKATVMDRVKWAYLKVALLFACSILITWVPASINRIYGLQHPSSPSFGLNVASAIVLPLQGFWNTVIYFTTSLQICRTYWGEFRNRKKRSSSSGFKMLEIPSVRREKKDKDKDTDSMTELSNVDPTHQSTNSL